MPEDEEGRRADDPEDGAQWGREPEQRDADHEETGVEGFLGHDVLAELQWLWGCGVPRCRERVGADLVSFWVLCWKGRGDVPNLFIAANPPTRKPIARRRDGFVILFGRVG